MDSYPYHFILAPNRLEKTYFIESNAAPGWYNLVVESLIRAFVQKILQRSLMIYDNFYLAFFFVYLNYYRPIFCKKSFGHIPSNSNCFIYPERFQGSANPWNQKARAKGSRSLRRIHETSRSIPSEANLWESVTNGLRRFEKAMSNWFDVNRCFYSYLTTFRRMLGQRIEIFNMFWIGSFESD